MAAVSVPVMEGVARDRRRRHRLARVPAQVAILRRDHVRNRLGDVHEPVPK